MSQATATRPTEHVTQTSSPGLQVPTRRMSFEESLADLPKFFAADGDPILSHLAATLSAVFPDGEDFFVRSVRHFRDQISDPELSRQVAGFIGQESVHGREHRTFNDRLHELGYPTKRIERWTERGLALRWRFMSPKANLAATAALEHFTATLAELLLTSEEMRSEFGHDGVRDLFVWHALEESEHKAVAFDVYRAVGGSERTRILTMQFLRFGFVIAMGAETAVAVLRDREARRSGKLRESWRRFRQSPLISREVWQQLREYTRPGFHPNDHDTSELVDEWRAKLFGDEGSLNHALAGRG